MLREFGGRHGYGTESLSGVSFAASVFGGALRDLRLVARTHPIPDRPQPCAVGRADG